MYTKNEPRTFVSVFTIASLAVGFAVPHPIGTSLVTNELLFETATFGAPLEVDLITGLELEDFKEEYIGPILVGQTSFVTPKNPPNKKQVVVSKRWLFVTAYSSTVDQTDSTPFITASGTHVRNGIVAANFLRFGTTIRFPTLYGDELFVVEDRMNSRYQYRVDIWMRSREEAKQFGAKLVPIEVIKEI